MTFAVRSITIDSRDHYALAMWWQDVLEGYGAPRGDSNSPDDAMSALAGPEGSALIYFVPVPEDKVVKNRVHVDVVPTSRTRDEEVEWLLGVGASLLADHRRPDGSGWVTLGDPEGNEFCVERSAAERSAAEPGTTEPGTAQPGTTEPGTTEPGE